MAEMISLSMDTSGLRRVIPDLVAYGRRTVAEQCVTSMGMILQDTQNFGDNPIPFVDVGRMDQELDAPAKNPGLASMGFTEGDEIVMARSNPNSNFNKITGSRWAFAFSPTANIRSFARAYGKENAARMFLEAVVNPIMERMRSARHSSGHFIQSGFKGPIAMCVTSPLFKNRYRAKAAMAPANSLNTLNPGELGKLDMTPEGGADFQITAMNLIGENGGNSVLDEKHAAARDAYASGPLQDAVNKETSACETELARRIAEKWPVFNQMLS